MKSRYSAYKLKLPKYIISTTNKNNIDFNTNTKQWEKEILEFCTNYSFEKLEIIDFIDDENESFVTFKATLIYQNKDSSIIEKSRFIKELNKWYYIDGVFLDNL